MCVYVCTHTYIHVTTINGKRGHEFEEGLKGIYRRASRKERERKSIIKLQCQMTTKSS